MTKLAHRSRIDLLQGTLDMLILRSLLLGPRHGHGIVQLIKQSSEEALHIDHGSLYPALQRLERRGWIKSTWGTSKNNRRAKFYRLTPSGRRQLQNESTKWDRLSTAIAKVMQFTSGEG